VVAVGAMTANAIRADAEPNRSVGRFDEPTCPASDGILRMRVPCSWTFSIGPGTEVGQRAAWILTGDFRFPDDYAAHKGTPDVPSDRMLIGIGDLTVRGHPEALDWPSVRRLHLPAGQGTPRRKISWSVRFFERAVRLSVQFGSEPSVTHIRLVDEVLASTTLVARG
jgi:hypothetical protein